MYMYRGSSANSDQITLQIKAKSNSHDELHNYTCAQVHVHVYMWSHDDVAYVATCTLIIMVGPDKPAIPGQRLFRAHQQGLHIHLFVTCLTHHPALHVHVHCIYM